MFVFSSALFPNRRCERHKKNPEGSLVQGSKTIKYIQTKCNRSMQQIIYIVFSILSFLFKCLRADLNIRTMLKVCQLIASAESPGIDFL